MKRAGTHDTARASRARAPPKKGGGGGKGTWGRVDDFESGKRLEKSDPCYDSEEDGAYVLVPADAAEGEPGSPPRHSYDPERPRIKGKLISLADYKHKVKTAMEEYFSSEDTEELERAVRDHDVPLYHYEFVKRAITMALDRHERERELTSRALSHLFGAGVVTTDQVGKGFERLFEVMEDLQLDIPEARKLVAMFLARAVADEVLPPSFLTDTLVESVGGNVVEQARVLLSVRHGSARLERIWGPGDGRSVDELKVEVRQLVEEYLLSRDVDEAAQCVREMRVPHFHHELVKRAVVLSLDGKEADQRAVSALLAHLHAQVVLTLDQLVKGFDRVLEALDDLALDVPDAVLIFAGFVRRAVDDGCLPSTYEAKLPPLPPRKSSAAADLLPADTSPHADAAAAAVEDGTEAAE